MKKIIPYIKSATPLPQYHLSVEFEDGVSGVVDLSGWKGVSKYWNDKEDFKNLL